MTTRKQSTLERFRSAVNLALTLPHPTIIYRAILAGNPETELTA